MRTAIFGCILFLFTLANAQLGAITTTDADGATIVEVITTDPIEGVATTQILQTVPATIAVTTTATTAVATTTPDQGPVGQPAPTGGPQSPTVYTYTTTDAAGLTTGIIDTFTPSFYQSQQSPSLSSGTILDYSSWIGMVGTNTATSQSSQVSGARVHWASGGLYGVVVAALSSVLGGAWLVLV